MNWKDINYWNQNSYGSAIKIKRSSLITLAVVACITTPGTNWIIPFLPKLIKSNIIMRYE
jgi:hypothetical protein